MMWRYIILIGGPLFLMAFSNKLVLAKNIISAYDRKSCELAIKNAESRYLIQPGLLRAMARVESGLNPFSINGDGHAYFPHSQAEAVLLVRQLHQHGVRFIDVGCLQIDLYFHNKAFASLEDAFDPGHNADYAARYLAENYALKGNWTDAVALYHAKDPIHQKAYLQAVFQKYKSDQPAILTKNNYQKIQSFKLSFMTIARHNDGEEGIE